MIKITRPRVLAVLFISYLFMVGYTAEAEDIRYKIIGQQSGLSDNKIQSILQDSLGTCWVGTAKGLDRIYEGRVFNYNEDPHLRNRRITFITQDKKNNIWVSAHGLFLYDYPTDSFKEIKTDDISIRPDWHAETDKGLIFCSNEGIARFNYVTEKMEMLIPRKWNETRYNGFCMASDSVAYVSSIDGVIYEINLHTKVRKEVYRFNEKIYPKSVIADSKGRAWFTIYRKGLFCFSSDGLVKEFLHGSSFFKEGIILDLKEHDGKLWIATDGEGIFIMDPETFKTGRLQDSFCFELPDEFKTISCMDLENDGLCLGTIRHGIIMQSKERVWGLKDDDLGSYRDHGANRSVINCLAEDHRGMIWVGIDGGGLHLYNPETCSLKSIEAFKKEKVGDVEPIDDRHLLVSVYSKGIYRYDTLTGKKTYIPVVDSRTNNTILTQDLIIGLERRSENSILVLAESIYEYDIDKGSIHESGIEIKGTHNLQLVHIDSSYTYVNTRYELFKIDNITYETERLLFTSEGDISCIRMADEELYLIKSYSLYRIDRFSGNIVEIPFHYNGSLMPVMESDKEGNIWLATRDDIICILDRNPENYIKFGRADGVVFNDFLEGVSHLSSSGYIYFGGNSGFCSIDSRNPEACVPPKKIHLLRANVNGRNVKHSFTPKQKNTTINIPWNYESMFLDISAEGDMAFAENRFRYTINESGKKTEVFSDSRLSLPTLSSGRYDINIAYADRSDRWINSGSTITVTVTPPWWKNAAVIWGSFLVMAIIIFSGIWVYHKRASVKATRTYQQRKEKLLENKLKFLTNISHELKTPLTLIYSPLQRLLEKNRFEDEQQKKLSHILSQAKYMNQLINTVLDSRKLEEGFGVLNIASYRLKPWIEGVCNEFRSEFESKSMTLEYEVSPSTDILNFDENKFKIILSNLLMNAWKYSEEGTKVCIRTSSADGMVRISVIDEGTGISEADAAKIFDRFTQSDRAAKGFGLGLAYTKLLVETHPGGRIGAVANQSKGSTFWFEIPEGLPCQSGISIRCNEENYQAPPADNTPVMENGFDLSNCTVLVAEDETDLLEFIEQELRPIFKEVYTARNGNEALEMAGSVIPDIIISDVMMPMKNGYELCSEIKNDISISHTPVILLTVLEDGAKRQTGYKVGADIYLTKPFEVSTLTAAIQNTLYNRALVREKFKSTFENVTIQESTFSNADEKFLTDLDGFIDSNISNDRLNAQMIIDHTCMGRATFYKKIKEVTGLGIMEYVTRKRMTKAAELLAKTQLPISEIARESGYSDNQYFSKVFRQHFNMSPSSYRSQSSHPDER